MKNTTKILSTIISSSLIATTSFGAGYEKSMSWSGKSVGQAGAVVGSVNGSEALYFNPAGLANIPGKKAEASFNFSPTFSQFKGPASFNTSGSITGSTGFSPVFGAMSAYQLTDKLGVGLGAYVSGGAKSKFENIDYSTTTGFSNIDQTKATVQTNLSVTELALGAGYEILPGLTFGAAWRTLMVKADFSTVSYIQNAAILNIFVTDVSKTKYNGYKLGLQYIEPNKNWGLGVNYRSSVSFTAKGTSSGTFESLASNSTKSSLTGGDATLTSIFPEQLSVGGYAKVCEKLKTALEYSFTHYSRNKALGISGSVVIPALGATKQLSDINQSWRNQHLIRLGNEYSLNEKVALRAGYSLTTQVTASQNARNTFSSPGTGHAITTGAGYALSENLEFNGALEYSFTKGTASNTTVAKTLAGADGTTKEVASDSEFSSHAYVVHLGTTYRF